MHELSIAMSLVDGACEEMAKHAGSRVKAVHLEVGSLSGVVREALEFSYSIACEGTPLAGSVLEITEIPASIFCGKCKTAQDVATIADMRCPSCGVPSNEVIRGRELLLTGLELIDDYEPATC